jgi:hypothetical protein
MDDGLTIPPPPTLFQVVRIVPLCFSCSEEILDSPRKIHFGRIQLEPFHLFCAYAERRMYPSALICT